METRCHLEAQRGGDRERQTEGEHVEADEEGTSKTEEDPRRATASQEYNRSCPGAPVTQNTHDHTPAPGHSPDGSRSVAQ